LPFGGDKAEILRFAQDDTSCRLGRGLLPLPNLRHSEPHLRGVSYFNREGGPTLLEAPPKKKLKSSLVGSVYSFAID